MPFNLSSILFDQCRIDRERPIIVGVSGGPDSLTLVDILNQHKLNIVIAHFNHQLRTEAAIEAQAVADLAQQLGARFCQESEDIGASAKVEGLSIEEAARKYRYAFLFQQAEAYHAQAVAVGHNADDQVETILMNLMRGAGLSGMRGMAYRTLPNAWSLTIPIIRPLIGVWREDILKFAAEKNLPFITDQSNTDTRFFRNRIRSEIIPFLEEYSAGLRKRLWQTAEILKEDYQVIEGLVQTAWEDCLVQTGEGYLALSLQALTTQPVSIQRFLIRRAIQQLVSPDSDIGFDVVDRSLNLFKSQEPSGQIDLQDRLRLMIEDGYVWVAAQDAVLPVSQWPQVLPGKSYFLDSMSQVSLPSGWLFNCEMLIAPFHGNELLTAITNPDPFQAWIDLENLNLPLIIRSRRQGDRLQTLGMEGKSIKISDLMINCKIPKRARQNWPLVVSGGQIVWAPGLRLAEPFRVRSETQSLLHIQLKR